jgi:hypothetical protein
MNHFNVFSVVNCFDFLSGFRDAAAAGHYDVTAPFCELCGNRKSKSAIRSGNKTGFSDYTKFVGVTVFQQLRAKKIHDTHKRR